MRKFSVIIGALLIFLIGSIFGALIRHGLQNFANGIARSYLGFGQPPAAAPPIEFWAYPHAELQSGGSGGGVSMNGELVFPTTHKAIWTTPDRFEDVILFYARQLDFKEPNELLIRQPVAANDYRGGLTADGPDDKHHIKDNGIPNQSPAVPRPARIETLVRRCRSYFLTVIITRADRDNHTHIVVVYDSWTKREDRR